MLGGSLVSTDSKVIGSDEGIKLISTDVKVLRNIPGNVNGIKLVINVGTELGTLDGSFDISNDVNIEVLLLVVSLEYTDGKVLGSDEGIKLGLSYSKLIDTILLNVVGITLGIDDRTKLGSSGVSFDDYNDGKL